MLSRLRWQLRDKHTADSLRQRTQFEEASRKAAQQVVTAVNEERRNLRIGGLAALGVFLILGVAFLVFYRRTQQQNTRVYAAITRLQS
jgi:hypothetical protein